MKSETEVVKASESIIVALTTLARVVHMQRADGVSDESIAANLNGYNIGDAAHSIVKMIDGLRKDTWS